MHPSSDARDVDEPMLEKKKKPDAFDLEGSGGKVHESRFQGGVASFVFWWATDDREIRDRGNISSRGCKGLRSLGSALVANEVEGKGLCKSLRRSPNISAL